MIENSPDNINTQDRSPVSIQKSEGVEDAVQSTPSTPSRLENSNAQSKKHRNPSRDYHTSPASTTFIKARSTRQGSIWKGVWLRTTGKPRWGKRMDLLGWSRCASRHQRSKNGDLLVSSSQYWKRKEARLLLYPSRPSREKHRLSNHLWKSYQKNP